jgi:RNA polymerase sigma factor for flagellar operon FliA
METDMSSRDIELWRTYRRTNDPGLRDRLIERYLPVVKYVAARVAGRLPSHLQIDDLYSAGLFGFLGAINDYDPEMGVEFSSYATPRIRGAIFDELRRLDWVPRTVRRKVREAERAIETLSGRLGREPTDEEVARELQTTVEAYRQLLADGVTIISLDAPMTHEAGGSSPRENVEDVDSPNPLLSLATKERRAILGRLIDRLPDRERQVLALYYYEELTMREVGELLGVTESRVSQLHSSAILRLRAALRRQRVQQAELTFSRTLARAHGGYGA